MPAGAAFFDLDKTVIAKASMVAFGRSFYDEGLISRRLVLRGLWGQLVYMHLGASEQKLARMRESVLALTKGWDQGRVKAIVREALEQVVEPIIYAEALELIQQHQAEAGPVFIVSASPEEIVLPLAEYLGVDGAIASRAEVDDEGRYTGEMRRYAYGPNKADAMLELAQTDEHRPGRVLRLLRLLHRRADARGGRPPGGGEPRPAAAEAGARARVGGAHVRPPGAPARPHAGAAGGADRGGGWLVAAGVAAGLVLWRRRTAPPPPPLALPTRLAASWRRRLRGR